MADFIKGSLPIKSYARPDKIFTADPEIVKNKVGILTSNKRKAMLKRARELFTE